MACFQRLFLYAAVVLVSRGVLVASTDEADPHFTRGDANADGGVDISDAISLLLSLFGGAQDLMPCDDAADSNDDGDLDISDAVFTLGYLFLGAIAPPPPIGECGSDPTTDELECEIFAPCPPTAANQNVAENWVARFSLSEFSIDSPEALTVDGDQNVYVTGRAAISHDGGSSYPDTEMVTVKYDSAGREVWAARYSTGDDTFGMLIAVDPDGNVYAAGDSAYEGTLDTVVVKYDATGSPLWDARYDSGGRDEVRAMILDEDGSLYMTCESDATIDASEDWLTIKYDTHGNEVWVDRYNGPRSTTDYPRAIALSPDGYLYVAGSADCDLVSRVNYTLIKYTRTGQRMWVSHYDGGEDSFDYATALAVDLLGNVYVTGRAGGECATVLFDSSGELLWTARFDGPANGLNDPVAIAVDGKRNVYVGGSSAREAGGDSDFFVISYDRHGRKRWSSMYDGPEGRRDAVRAMTFSEETGIVVTGYVNDGSGGDDSGRDLCTIAYDETGRERWVALYDGPAQGRDEAACVVAGREGRVYVTGSSERDFLTIEYVATEATER